MSGIKSLLLHDSELLTQLGEIGDDASDGASQLFLPVYEKLFWGLSTKVMPEVRHCGAPCFLKADGRVYEELSDETDVLESGKFISHECLDASTLRNTLLGYYEQSPYWDTFLRSTGVNEDEAKELELTEDSSVDDAPFETAMEELFCGFFEKGAVDLMDALGHSPLTYFELDGSCGCTEDECYVLKSILLPQYLKHEHLFGTEEDKEIVRMIERSISLLSDMFHGGSIRILEKYLEYGYFIQFCKISDARWVFPYGLYNMRKTVMVAGRIIDNGILLLDEKYHFLNDKIRTGGGWNGR